MKNGRFGASSGNNRVNRGGSWNNNDDNCAVSCRNSDNPDYSDVHLGFRVVRSK
ncbi:MAG: SUMF1/EgtB/PvdO family nonheme iron enzyme [Treponema sp.]|nr:SUMF1/EgtB/PvdO family nonheme iron enzyme [Treponema sp.]